MSIDSVTLAVVRGAFEELVREMDDTLVSSAFSPIISEGRDCAHALFDPGGDLIVQGEQSLPLFVASMQAVCRHVVQTTGLGRGDVLLCNHPDVGGTHVQDMKMIMPLYVGDRLCFYLGSAGHWSDVGGAVPGGWHPEARSVFAEGLVVDGLRLVKGGVVDEEVIGMFLTNARVPVPLEGDINAHLAALNVGQRRLDELVGRYGVETLLDVASEMKRRSEQAMRARIRELPDRTVAFSAVLDNDGVNDAPITIACDLSVRGDSLVIDLTRSSDQSEGPINLPRPGTLTACMVAVKHWWPEIPINAGCFTPVEIVTRPGSVLDSRFPAPVAGYSEVLLRVVDVVFACLGQIDSAHAIGCSFGTTSGISISSSGPDGIELGAWYLDGGYGGSEFGDGLSGGTPAHSMARLPPVEIFEHRLPVRILQRAIRPDSGGDGTHRGGCGTVYEFEFTRNCSIAFLGDRSRQGPFGTNGGLAGAPASWSFIVGGHEWRPPMGAKGTVTVAAGDRMCVMSPGGGGWGPPEKRSRQRRDEDIVGGYVKGAAK